MRLPYVNKYPFHKLHCVSYQGICHFLIFPYHRWKIHLKTHKLTRNRTNCNYICNSCFNLLKKREALENNLMSCEEHITSFGNDANKSNYAIDTLEDVPILHSTPIKRKVADGDELDNAFTKARSKLFHNAVDGKTGVEVKLI